LAQNYWTFGRKFEDSGGKFAFCPSGTVSVGWGDFQPKDGNGNCVQLVMKNSGDMTFLINANCSENAFFACQVCAMHLDRNFCSRVS
jgi:hypothetical protein